ncbi:MAG: hypothetical protein DI531_09000 [Brevundimonas sp.]|nr:MAG: hypothetical protein DI531_09000 [Brevundimonas sp.]
MFLTGRTPIVGSALSMSRSMAKRIRARNTFRKVLAAAGRSARLSTHLRTLALVIFAIGKAPAVSRNRSMMLR